MCTCPPTCTCTRAHTYMWIHRKEHRITNAKRGLEQDRTQAVDMSTEQNSQSGTVTGTLCPLCTFESPTLSATLSHLHIVHSSDPHFAVTCGVDGCATTSKSFTVLYSHIYRRHPQFIKKRKAFDVSVVTPVNEDTRGQAIN